MHLLYIFALCTWFPCLMPCCHSWSDLGGFAVFQVVFVQKRNPPISCIWSLVPSLTWCVCDLAPLSMQRMCCWATCRNVNSTFMAWLSSSHWFRGVKNGLAIITDRGGSGGWTGTVLEDGWEKGGGWGGSCCFKSRGDNSEDAKSMEGSMKEMSF